MSELIRNDFNSDEWEGAHPIWPMYTKIPDITTFDGNLKLKNAVAFLCPMIDYGPSWANIVTGGSYEGYTNLPALHMTDFVVRSNYPLNGAATLDYSDYEYPVMDMDNNTVLPVFTTTTNTANVGAAYKLTLHSPNGTNGTVVSGSAGTGANMEATDGKIGLVPIAPIEYRITGTRQISWQMNVYFWITRDVVIPATDTDPETTTTETYYYKFVSGNSTDGAANNALRSRRLFLKCNFRNWDGLTRPTWVDNVMQLDNGTLYRSTTPFTVE
jgi:hypothetical protein